MKVARTDENYIEIKRRFIAEGRTFVHVSVQEKSVPDSESLDGISVIRERKLIVDERGIMYGGTRNSEIDEKIRERALKCIAAKKGASMDIGSNQVMFEYVGPPPTLVIIGKNSVGRAIARIAAGLDFKVVSVEEDVEQNEENIEENIEENTEENGAPEQRIKEKLARVHFDEATYIVVVHPLGYIGAINYCLDLPWAYFGVLGSRSKIEALLHILTSRGLTPAKLDKIHAPLGFDIGAQTPDEIAIAALAEIIAAKNGKLT